MFDEHALYLDACHSVAAVSISFEDPDAPPQLCDVCNLSVSPLVPARQRFSSLISGNSKLLILLYRRAGYSDVNSWLANCRDDAMLFRRCAMVGDAWLFRRHWTQYLTSDAWPWRLSKCIDLRLSREERLATMSDFLNAHERCLDPYFSRRLRARILEIWLERFGCKPSASDLLGWEPLIFALTRWAYTVVLAIGALECRHRRCAIGNGSYTEDIANCSSKYVNREAALAKECRRIERDGFKESEVKCDGDTMPMLTDGIIDR